MRRRWLLSVGLCAVAALATRVGSAGSDKPAALTHVAVLAGGNLGNEVSQAQARYLRSQPNHWRGYMLKHER